MSTTSFHQVITEHMALSERNKRLEQEMPLDRYREEDAPAATDAAPRDDMPSWWETENGECPPPPLGWDDD